VVLGAVEANRLQQVSWTNPLTNKILLDAGLSATTLVYDTTEHRDFVTPKSIPRITENGNTAGGDDVGIACQHLGRQPRLRSDVRFAECVHNPERSAQAQHEQLPKPRVSFICDGQP
jgi:hypothetical protein